MEKGTLRLLPIAAPGHALGNGRLACWGKARLCASIIICANRILNRLSIPGLQHWAKTGIPSLCIAVALTLLSHFAFTSTGHDDPHLTYWIADSIQEGHFNGYNGHPFEQTSSLFHAMTIAALSSLLRTPAPVTAKILEFATSIFILSLSCTLMARKHGLRRSLLGTTALASLPFFAYWSWGGLETSLFVLFSITQSLILAAMLKTLSRRSIAACGLMNALFIFLRPEALIVIPLLAAIWFLIALRRYRQRGRRCDKTPLFGTRIFSLLLPVAIAPMVLGFGVRYAIFGRILPSTVYAKSLFHDSFIERLQSGSEYVFLNPIHLGPLAGIAIMALLFWSLRVAVTSKTSVSAFMVSIGIIQLLAVVLAGGDWMGMGRFLVSPLVLLCLNLLIHLPSRSHADILACSLLGLSSTFYLLTAFNSSLYADAKMLHLDYFSTWRRSRVSRTALVSGQPSVISIRPDAQASKFECIHPYESTKIPNLRDCTFLRALEIAQSKYQIFQFKDGDRILSHQAGMVPYHLIKSYPGLTFLDPVGLGSQERTTLGWAFVHKPDTKKSGVSKTMTMLFIDKFRPEYAFFLGNGYCRELRRRGYGIAVVSKVRSWAQSATEVLYVRKDRLHLSASGAPIGCRDLRAFGL